MADKMLVRLKPYEPKRRHVMQSYTHTPSGLRFEAARGWYRVDATIAAYLSRVPQIENDPDSPLAFDVMTEEQARQLDEREERTREQRASASNPNDVDRTPTDLVTADLHGRRGGVTEPQTRADAPTPGLRRDGAVEPGKPPHYAADDPRGFHRLIHKEELPDITSPVPGPPPVTGGLAGARRATADEPHEPAPQPPPTPLAAMLAGGAAPPGLGQYPPPGYGDPESLEAHVKKVDEQLKSEAQAQEKAQEKEKAARAQREAHASQQRHTSQRPPPKDEK